MVAKTLTIMEDAYKLLIGNKLENESFSDEIRRILSKRRLGPLLNFFGIISSETGEDMLKDLESVKNHQSSLLSVAID